MKTSQINQLCVLFLTFSVLILSCSDIEEEEVSPDNDEATPSSSYAETNDWILRNMEYYYFWNDEIPLSPDLTLQPISFFESLLYTFNETSNPEGDRFSFISEDADELLASFNGEETTTGMEFNLYYKNETGSEIIGQVIYTIPESPAALMGITRGDIFTKVDGQTLTDQNYIDLLYNNNDLTLTMAVFKENEYVALDETINIYKTLVQENPIFMDSIYVQNGVKIGYIVYNQFIPGPNGSESEQYDEELNEIFSRFKSSGVTELIVDLRYNPGGYVTSAINLASLIGIGVSSNDLFIREEYNSTLQNQLERAYGEDYFNENFYSRTGNIGNQLSRVYFLVTNASASSSELVINGLKPYMDVYLIGETTYGKNVGSITITDETGDIDYALQPIIMKAYNSLGNSDYSAGFIPDVEISESREFVPFGNIYDPLLGTALAVISGSSARIAAISDFEAPKLLNSTISRKKVTLKLQPGIGLNQQ
ncbi:S41 family peptidase [Flexithrix dorotheae]|uniref:S41 family peptidase n=1 Tax=Flexithrix dorotheae TaxID=70993 RepID=UPI00037747F6|nr:S41 family peptidase [Flexithrix dorotheae]